MAKMSAIDRHVGSSSRWAGGSLARIIRGLQMILGVDSVRFGQSDYFIEIWFLATVSNPPRIVIKPQLVN